MNCACPNNSPTTGYRYGCRCERCKHGMRKDAYERRRGDPEARIQTQREWFAKNPARRILYAAKSRAKAKGLAFTLRVENLLPLPEKCPVLGTPLYQGTRHDCNNAHSIDRLDNAKGYTPDNIRVVSRRANDLKGDARLDESIVVAYYHAEQADYLTPLMESRP